MLVGVRQFSSGVGKQNQRRADVALAEAAEHGGAVGAAAVGYDDWVIVH
jgi:pyruvate/2-oxoglutarate/acetoin dehydrogenase E1 component